MNLLKLHLICLFLALTGCAETTWQRADTGPAVAASDHKQCQEQAMLAARRLMSIDPQN